MATESWWSGRRRCRRRWIENVLEIHPGGAIEMLSPWQMMAWVLRHGRSEAFILFLFWLAMDQLITFTFEEG